MGALATQREAREAWQETCRWRFMGTSRDDGTTTGRDVAAARRGPRSTARLSRVRPTQARSRAPTLAVDEHAVQRTEQPSTATRDVRQSRQPMCQRLACKAQLQLLLADRPPELIDGCSRI